MKRRRLLVALGAGAAAVSGCTARPDTGGVTDGATTDGTTTDAERTTTTDGTDRPDDCPTSQGLGVEWPAELDAAAVESFVEAYERVYYRDVVVDYVPQSRLDSYGLSGGVTDPPERRGDGWVVSYSGSGGVYRPTVSLEAERTAAPDGVDVVPIDAIESGPVTETLEAAAEAGNASYHVEPPGERVDRSLDSFESVADDFELAGRGDSDSFYVDVDGETVELTVSATNFHGDYWWTARYYVDRHVVRRTADEDTDPRDGELLECRAVD